MVTMVGEGICGVVVVAAVYFMEELLFTFCSVPWVNINRCLPKKLVLNFSRLQAEINLSWLLEDEAMVACG